MKFISLLKAFGSKENSPIKTEFLTLKHYKEPLIPIKEGKGFGYYGAISITMDGEKMQCHVCGKLFNHVGIHAQQAHKITVRGYREKFKLAPTTALMSEAEREKRKHATMMFFAKATPEQKREWKLKAKRARARARNIRQQPVESLESKNKKGTCPQQLLEKIKEVSRKLGHCPSLGEFIDVTGGQRYKHLIFKVFGSWNKALKLADMDISTKPTAGGDRNGIKTHSDEVLLESLAIYAQENRKIPTATDCKRGLLPSYEVYQRHFGTFEKARQKAGVYKFVDSVK